VKLKNYDTKQGTLIDAVFVEGGGHICVSSGCAVYALENMLTGERYPVFGKQVGKSIW